MKKIILMVGHGSPVGQANIEFEDFVQHFKEWIHTDTTLRHSYVELAKPNLKEALDAAANVASQVIVLPLFLLTAGHIKNDIRTAVKTAQSEHPEIEFRLAQALGVEENMVNLVIKRLRALHQPSEPEEKDTQLLMICRGTSDKAATDDFQKIVNRIDQKTDYDHITSGYVAVNQPCVKDALEALVQQSPKSIHIQPYLLFKGQLVQEIQELHQYYSKKHPHISIKLSDPLGEDDLIFDLLKKRLHDVETA